MRKFLWFLWLAAALISCPTKPPAPDTLIEAPPPARGELIWSLALVKGNESISFSQPVAMNTGDTFTIIIHSPNRSCFAYVIAQDSARQMKVLLNKPLLPNESWQSSSLRITPPSGSETFYIVMSTDQQNRLQGAIDAFNSQNNARNSQALNNAIAETRRDASQFNENPERPAGMGAAFRSSNSNNAAGTEYSGVNTYVKTIVIRH